MKKGSVTLGEVAERATYLEVACTRCDRRGRYRLAKLVASLGADFPMTDLGSEITDCTRRNNSAAQDRCDVYFPDLREIMSGDEPLPRSENTGDE
jgi:hypothetical protein